MNALLILLATAAVGVEVGWEPLDTGGHEYTIQIEPQVFDLLKRGKDEIFSEVPPEVDVRRFRFLIGEGKLARVTTRPGSNVGPGSVPSPAVPPLGAGDDVARRPKLGTNPQDEGEAPRLPAAKENESTVGAPARLDDSDAAPLKQATHDEPPEAVSAGRLATPPEAAAAEPARPWYAFVSALVLLFCSLGANIYLAWTAWDARSRYRATVAKLRAAPAS